MKKVVKTFIFEKNEITSESLKFLTKGLKNHEVILAIWPVKDKGYCQAIVNNKGEFELL